MTGEQKWALGPATFAIGLVGATWWKIGFPSNTRKPLSSHNSLQTRIGGCAGHNRWIAVRREATYLLREQITSWVANRVPLVKMQLPKRGGNQPVPGQAWKTSTERFISACIASQSNAACFDYSSVVSVDSAPWRYTTVQCSAVQWCCSALVQWLPGPLYQIGQ